MLKTATLGFPRIGANRELKKAVEGSGANGAGAEGDKIANRGQVGGRQGKNIIRMSKTSDLTSKVFNYK